MGRVVIGEIELGGIAVTEHPTTHYATFYPVSSSPFETFSEPKSWMYPKFIKDNKGKIKLFTYAEFKALYPDRSNICHHFKKVQKRK
jgi:hypothetical protein